MSVDRRKKGTQLCIRSCDRPGRIEDTLQDTLPLTLAPRLLRQWSPRNQDLPKNPMLRRGYIEPSCQRKKTSVLEGDFHAVLTAGQATLQDRLKLRHRWISGGQGHTLTSTYWLCITLTFGLNPNLLSGSRD